MATPTVHSPPKRKASLRVSDAPVVDDRFQRPDRAKGQDVSISRSIYGDLVLLHRVALDPESSLEVRQSLLQTAQATARFRDPHVLPVREARLEGDSLVFVQDYPHGPLLSDAMTPAHPFPLVEALTWMRQFARSLEAAQSEGLTLSQICPTDFVVSDLMVGAGERELISLCPPVPAGWWLEVEDPVYASPEQKAGEACDIRSSLFSAGAVLAVMITGHRPDRDTDWAPLLGKAALPKLVDQALKRVLNPDPAKRCGTPSEWVALLNKAIAAQGPATPLSHPARVASAPVLVADPPPVAKPEPQPEPLAETPPAPQKAKAPPPAEAVPSKPKAKPTAVAPATPAKQTAAPLPVEETQTRVIAMRSAPRVPLDVLHRSTFVLQDTPRQSRPWGAIIVIVAAVAVLIWAFLSSSGPHAPDTPATASKTDTPAARPTPKAEASANKGPAQPSVGATAPTSAPSATLPSADLPTTASAAESASPPSKPVVAPAPPAAVVTPSATPIPSIPATVAPAPPPPQAAQVKPRLPATPAPALLPAPEKLGEIASKHPSQPSSSAPPDASASPPIPATVPEAKPPPSGKADLLKQASAASGAERINLYRKVLAEDAHNPEALRGLVRTTLADMPPKGERLDELKQWADELVALNDPLGTHAMGCITLQQAGEAGDDLTAATKRLAQAVVLLKRSLAAKQVESYFFLVQAYINLHNVRVQNKAGPEAERTRRALLADIANAPDEVPAKDSRSLAVRLEGLLKERAANGKPHPHAAFLQAVIRSLYTKAADKGDEAAREWLKSGAKG